MIRASAPYTWGWGSFVLLKMDRVWIARGGSLSTLHRNQKNGWYASYWNSFLFTLRTHCGIIFTAIRNFSRMPNDRLYDGMNCIMNKCKHVQGGADYRALYGAKTPHPRTVDRMTDGQTYWKQYLPSSWLPDGKNKTRQTRQSPTSWFPDYK